MIALFRVDAEFSRRPGHKVRLVIGVADWGDLPRARNIGEEHHCNGPDGVSVRRGRSGVEPRGADASKAVADGDLAQPTGAVEPLTAIDGGRTDDGARRTEPGAVTDGEVVPQGSLVAGCVIALQERQDSDMAEQGD